MGETSGSKSDQWLVSARSVADGASLHYVGFVVVTIVGISVELLLTRVLGVGLYGIYALGYRIVTSLQMFLNFGSDVSITKYLAANRGDERFQNKVLLLSYLTSLFVSLLVGAVLFVAAPTINAYTVAAPVFTPALRVFAVALPFQALARIAANTFRGLEMPVQKTALMVARPTLKLAAIALAILLGYSLLGIVAAYALAAVVLCLFAVPFALSRTGLVPSWGDGLSRAEVAEFYDFSAPMTFSRAASLLYTRIDVFMVGIFLTSAHIGVYNVSLLLGTFVALPLKGLNQLFPSVASQLYSEDDYDALESVYVTVTRWSITASLFVAASLFVYRTEVLALFGEEFVAGAGVVAFIVAGQLINSAAGPANDLLTMTDHQYLVLINHWTFGVLNLVLNYYFILQFGMVGAALATASVLAALNAVRVVEVWYLEGLFAYSAAIWKPLVAIAGAVATMWALRTSLDGLPLLFVGGLLGAGTYCGLLYLFGIEDADRRLASEYLELVPK